MLLLIEQLKNIKIGSLIKITPLGPFSNIAVDYINGINSIEEVVSIDTNNFFTLLGVTDKTVTLYDTVHGIIKIFLNFWDTKGDVTIIVDC